MNIFVINGHEKYPYNEGRLNQTIFEAIIEKLSKKHLVESTVIKNGYDVKEEQKKFLHSDVIIFQMPIYWFSMPALFKKYIELIYEYGTFYKGSSDYGRGGMLQNKSYMYSLTLNSPEYAFDSTGSFFDGRSIDDMLLPLHKLQEFCAMKALPTFACYDVVKNPNISQYLKNLDSHLNKYF